MNFWSHTLKRYVEIVTWLLLYHYLFIVYSGYVITGQASSVHKRAPHITEVTIQIRRHASNCRLLYNVTLTFSLAKVRFVALCSKAVATVWRWWWEGRIMEVEGGGREGGGAEQPYANNIDERGYPPGVLRCNMYA